MALSQRVVPFDCVLDLLFWILLAKLRSCGDIIELGVSGLQFSKLLTELRRCCDFSLRATAFDGLLDLIILGRS
jgi:hypothetical protein